MTNDQPGLSDSESRVTDSDSGAGGLRVTEPGSRDGAASDS